MKKLFAFAVTGAVVLPMMFSTLTYAQTTPPTGKGKGAAATTAATTPATTAATTKEEKKEQKKAAKNAKKAAKNKKGSADTAAKSM